jgi:integrase
MAIIKDEKGRWGFSVRYTDAFGNKKQKKAVNKDWTKKQAKLEEEKFIASATNTTITLDELRIIYIESKSIKLRTSTIIRKDNYYSKHIKPYFGKMRINNIDENTIDKWQAIMLKKNLKLSTIKGIQAELMTMLRFAYKRRYIDRPVIVDYPTNENPEEEKIKFVTKEQFDFLSDYIENNCDRFLYVLIQLLYYSGMRISEALALTNLDIDGNVVTVSKSLSARTHKVTKTKTGKTRKVVLSDRIIKLLQEQIEYYRKCGMLGNVYLFGGNKPYTYGHIRNTYSSICEKLNFQPNNVHAFRHTHVSNLIKLGFNTFEIADRTGHSVQMINKVYGHVIINPQYNMAEKLENL